MKKLSFLGIGPRIAIVFLPWLAATITLSCIKSGVFRYTSEKNKIILFTGIVLMAAGLIFYFSTVRILMAGLKETKLQTKGPYSLCQNPLYAAIFLIIIPALSLLLNSWLVLTSSLAGYIMFRIFINNEPPCSGRANRLATMASRKIPAITKRIPRPAKAMDSCPLSSTSRWWKWK